MSHNEVLRLPIRTFWTLSGNVNRIRASRDVRQFRMLQAVLSDFAAGLAGKRGEACAEYARRLEAEIGTVVKTESNFSDDGWNIDAINQLTALQAKAERHSR